MTDQQKSEYQLKLSQLVLILHDLTVIDNEKQLKSDYLASKYNIHTDEEYKQELQRIKGEISYCEDALAGKLPEVENKNFKFVTAPCSGNKELMDLLSDGWEISSSCPKELRKKEGDAYEVTQCSYVLTKCVKTLVKGN